MGIQSIMKAKEIVLIAFGEKKLEAIEKLKSGIITEDFPASQLLNHPNVTIIYGGTK
jgi:glucosamine-6-phosphate deaminase